MKVSIENVNYIAKLAKLNFTEEQAEKMAKEFESILTHFESIDKFDLSEVHLDKIDEHSKSVLRKDEMTVFEDKIKLFQNVKTMRGTSLQVPKIIE